MRKSLALCTGLIAVALTGCTAGGNTKTGMRSSNSLDDNADYQRMTEITRDAMLRGYRVVWVHPMQKERKKSQGG